MTLNANLNLFNRLLLKKCKICQVLMGGQDGKSQKVKEEIQATLVSEACPDRQVPMEWTLYQGWWEKGADLVSPDNQVRLK